jgi:hypothetical protein
MTDGICTAYPETRTRAGGYSKRRLSEEVEVYRRN